jgi:UDP-perosamine 4-acetyltransferase
MNKRIILIGSGGHALSICEIIKWDSNIEIQVNLENSEATNLPGYPTILWSEVLGQLSSLELVLAIGNVERRKKFLDEKIKDINSAEFPNLIHPRAYVSSSAKLGRGVVVMPHAYIGPNSKIGDFSIINTSAVVEHESVIGSNNAISPGVLLAGKVRTGDNCFFGIGAKVSPGITLGSNVAVGGNSFVRKNAGSNVKLYGSPALEWSEHD